jgi:glutamyl-Q tRNA(Asp) synthetase
MGSLVAALGSYLRAKSRQGQWLVRMEDIDPLREVKGAADNILLTLEAHGLHWDGELVYQSQRQELYQHALSQLIADGQVYACTCTRKALKKVARFGDYGMIYPTICRSLDHPYEGRYAIRVRTHDNKLCFNDLRLGQYCQQLESELGDFIIKRSDGYFAYQLAVVIDDQEQGITEVCRGEDLLDNTVRQIHLQNLLNYRQPEYYHLPMVTNKSGQKLSKQTHAPAIKVQQASLNLIEALSFLAVYNSDQDDHSSIVPLMNQLIKDELVNETPETILQWVIHS